MFGGKPDGVNGAGPLPIPSHKSYAKRLVEPSLSQWTPNPTSLPLRTVPNLQQPSARGPVQVPTVPPRSKNCDSDNWVDLEELYRWLQELEDTKVEPCSNEDGRRGKK